MRRTFVIVALAAAAAVGCRDTAGNRANDIGAERSIGTTGSDQNRVVKETDRIFFDEVIAGNLAEADLGKLAIERSKNAEVKKFGQMMIDDHTKAADALNAVAAQHNVTSPAG